MYPLKFEPILKQTLWGRQNYSVQAFEFRLERSRRKLGDFRRRDNEICGG